MSEFLIPNWAEEKNAVELYQHKWKLSAVLRQSAVKKSEWNNKVKFGAAAKQRTVCVENDGWTNTDKWAKWHHYQWVCGDFCCSVRTVSCWVRVCSGATHTNGTSSVAFGSAKRRYEWLGSYIHFGCSLEQFSTTLDAREVTCPLVTRAFGGSIFVIYCGNDWLRTNESYSRSVYVQDYFSWWKSDNRTNWWKTKSQLGILKKCLKWKNMKHWRRWKIVWHETPDIVEAISLMFDLVSRVCVLAQKRRRKKFSREAPEKWRIFILNDWSNR